MTDEVPPACTATAWDRDIEAAVTDPMANVIIECSKHIPLWNMNATVKSNHAFVVVKGKDPFGIVLAPTNGQDLTKLQSFTLQVYATSQSYSGEVLITVDYSDGSGNIGEPLLVELTVTVISSRMGAGA